MSLEKMRRKCQQLTDEERMAILQKATAGTLALLGDNDYPYAVPISYACREGKQYFHIALAGHKVDAIRKCAKGTKFCSFTLIWLIYPGRCYFSFIIGCKGEQKYRQ